MELGNHRDTRGAIKAMGLTTFVVGVTLVMIAKDKEVAKMLMEVISVGALVGAIEAYLKRRESKYRYTPVKSNSFLTVIENILLAGGLFTIFVVMATVISLVKFFSLKLALVIGLAGATYIMLVIVAKEIINIVAGYLHKKGIK